jgi:hypothetical protein
MTQHRSDLVENLQSEGLYYIDLLDAGDLASDPINTEDIWVSFDFSGRDLSGNIMDNTTTSSSGIKGWATQAAQNASQRVMNALGTAAKKNRVRLKYGTRVYLVDGSQKERSNRNRNNY